jgi:integrase
MSGTAATLLVIGMTRLTVWPAPLIELAAVVTSRLHGHPDTGVTKVCPRHPTSLSETPARLSERAGLPRLTPTAFVTPRATLLLDNGVPPKVAAERLGHSDATLFTNLHIHVTPAMQRDANGSAACSSSNSL